MHNGDILPGTLKREYKVLNRLAEQVPNRQGKIEGLEKEIAEIQEQLAAAEEAGKPTKAIQNKINTRQRKIAGFEQEIADFQNQLQVDLDDIEAAATLPYDQLTNERQKAMYVRAYDEANNTKHYRLSTSRGTISNAR